MSLRADPADAAAHWLCGASVMDLPDAVILAARTALTDWFACCIGGMREEIVVTLKRRARGWSASGSAPLFGGGTAAPMFAALVHSAAAHALDFDDTHIYTDTHFSGPTWAVVLSQLSQPHRPDDDRMCRAFVAGFEVGARMGGRHIGHALAQRGFQPTGLLGRVAGAAAGSVLAGLDVSRSAHALAIAATQTAGLTATFGSMLKPLQGGRTAFDAVMAVELAQDGVTAPTAVFRSGGALARSLVQDGTADFATPDFSSGWEILRNSTKAYACLHGIHPSIDAARELSGRMAGRRAQRVRVMVGPMVPRIARYTHPVTPLEAKFSLAYCVAIGLLGRSVGTGDFDVDLVGSAAVRQLLDVIEVVPTEGRKMIDAGLEVTLADGSKLCAEVPIARGHPGRPLQHEEIRDKFYTLVEPVLGEDAERLFRLLQEFPSGHALRRAVDLAQAGMQRQ